MEQDSKLVIKISKSRLLRNMTTLLSLVNKLAAPLTLN